MSSLIMCNKANYGSKRLACDINYIVVHYTGNHTDTAENNCKYFRDNVVKASAHYFVDDEGWMQSVPDEYTAYSVGKQYGSKNLFGVVKNGNSINIELCSKDGVITQKTQDLAICLIKNLMEKYNIPATHVYRHWDVCSKECPGWPGWYGKNAPKWDAFHERLATDYLSVKVGDWITTKRDVNLTYNGTKVGTAMADRCFEIEKISKSGKSGRIAKHMWISLRDDKVKKL